jgi:hypothetical protein
MTGAISSGGLAGDSCNHFGATDRAIAMDCQLGINRLSTCSVANDEIAEATSEQASVEKRGLRCHDA